jgi:hypothetical protein
MTEPACAAFAVTGGQALSITHGMVNRLQLLGGGLQSR